MFGTALGVMISADTPSGFPTVIEPGSGVSTADFVIFNSDSSTYARNGTTGAIDYSSASAYTVLNSAVTHTNNGGIVFLQSGQYNLGGNNLVIACPGVTLQGSGSYPRGFGSLTTDDSEIVGNVFIEAENVQLHDLTINGHLNLTSKTDLSSAAHTVYVNSVSVKNGVSIYGRLGAMDTEVPYSITFEFCSFEALAGYDMMAVDNDGHDIQHIFVKDSVFDQENSPGGDMVSFSGRVDDVSFSNTMFMTYVNDVTIINESAKSVGAFAGGLDSLSFIACKWEIGGTGITCFKFNDGIEFPQTVHVTDSWFQPIDAYGDTVLIESNESDAGENFAIFFESTEFQFRTIRVKEIYPYTAAGTQAFTPYFSDCWFHHDVAFQQQGLSRSIGIFHNCKNVNSIGNVTTNAFKWYGTGYCTVGFFGNASTVYLGETYEVRDRAVLLTVKGGSDVNLLLYDITGTLLVSNLASASRMYLDIGMKFMLGWTNPPIVIVEAV
jgi:hypothetical protein